MLRYDPTYTPCIRVQAGARLQKKHSSNTLSWMFSNMVLGPVPGFPADVSFGTISTAYLLRAARLVVVYDKELRRKYMRLVKPAVQWKCMLAVLTACCVISLIVQLSFAALR